MIILEKGAQKILKKEHGAEEKFQKGTCRNSPVVLAHMSLQLTVKPKTL